MSVTAKTISRRTLLRGAGTAIALPLLDAMSPTRLLTASSSAAAATKAPLRMGYFFVPNGMHMPDWKPEKDGAGFDLKPILQRLANHQKSINVLTGLTLDGAFAHGDGGGDHARAVASFLTGAHPRKTDGADIQNDISVDQVAAQHVGDATRFSSLELGLEASAKPGRCDSGYSCIYTSNISWRSQTSPMSKEIDPTALFDRLFAGQTVKETKTAKTVREKYRKSVLDFVLDDAERLQRSLGATDRRKVDEYLYSVRDVERRINGAEKLRLNEEGVPDYPRPAGVPKEMAKHAELMMDMVALTFQTDSTRILTFMFTNAGSNRSYPELDISEGHHDLSHHGKSEEKQAKIAVINRFHIDQFGYLLTRLDAIREGDGSLLDNCMLVYGSGISDGDRHNHDDLPIILAGGGAGKIKSGRHIRYANKTPLCNLYLWMLNQMGAKVDKFGDSTAPLDKLG
jgi:hypothetical protein